MKRLSDIGFTKVGEWKNENSVFKYDIENHLQEKNLLYAFIINKEVLYIGKTTDTLKNRMNGYKNASGSQKTNVRIKAKIIEKLFQFKVEIYILIDKENLTFGKYKISLASGLEDNLIASITPKWNFRGKIRIKELEIPAENQKIMIENSPQISTIKRTINIILGEEYWNNGFFNFSKKELDILPNEPTQITLILGLNDDYFIPGHFLFSTESKQPRVRGNKTLKEWFQMNYSKGEKIEIDILNKDLYRIK